MFARNAIALVFAALVLGACATPDPEVSSFSVDYVGVGQYEARLVFVGETENRQAAVAYPVTPSSPRDSIGIPMTAQAGGRVYVGHLDDRLVTGPKWLVSTTVERPEGTETYTVPVPNNGFSSADAAAQH